MGRVGQDRILGPLLAGMAAGLVLGAGLFWLFGDSTLAGALEFPRRTRAHAGPAVRAGFGFEADRTPARDATRDPARDDLGPPLPRELSESVTALAHAAPAPKIARGTKALCGHVDDPQGRPLAGVTVRATRQKARRPEVATRGDALAALPTLEERLSEACNRWYAELADQRETTSGADGSWQIDGLQDGDWRVCAGKPGFAFTTPRDVVTPDAVADFHATLVVRVPLAVRLPDGSTPDEAALVLAGANGAANRVEAWRADAPWLALEQGSYEVKATLGDLETGPAWPAFLSSRTQQVSVRTDTPPVEFTFTLLSASGIAGHVKLAAADAQDPVNVRMILLQRGKEPDVGELSGPCKQAHVDARDGAYAFKDLAPGHYLVGVVRGESPPVFGHAVVDVGDGTVTQDLIVPPLERSQCIVAKVSSPEGLPLDKVDFSLIQHRDSDGGSDGWSRGVFAAQRGAGLFWIVLPHAGEDRRPYPPDGVARVELEARHARFGSKRVDVSGPGAEVEIRLGEPATLVVTIPGYVGSDFVGRVGLSIERADADASGRNAWFNRPDDDPLGADGRQSFGVREAGALRVVMSIRFDDISRGQVEMRVGHLDLDLHPGENSALFPIPALQTVVFELPASVTNGNVLLQRTDGEAWCNDRFGDNYCSCVRVDDQGRATIAEVPAGAYVARAWGDGFNGEMKVAVPTSGVVCLRARVKDCLKVWLENETGKLAKAGFQSDDLVIAIGGTPLQDVKRDLEAIIAANVAKDEVAFTVVRDGRTLELSFDVKAMVNYTIAGGGFEAASRE